MHSMAKQGCEGIALISPSRINARWSFGISLHKSYAESTNIFDNAEREAGVEMVISWGTRSGHKVYPVPWDITARMLPMVLWIKGDGSCIKPPIK